MIGEDEGIEETPDPSHQSLCILVVIDALPVAGTQQAELQQRDGPSLQHESRHPVRQWLAMRGGVVNIGVQLLPVRLGL